MDGNFVHCKYCGATFELSGEFCPNCHMTISRKYRGKLHMLTKYPRDALPLWGVFTLLCTAFLIFAVLAGYGIFEAVAAKQNAQDYHRVCAYIESGQYDKDMALYKELSDKASYFSKEELTENEQFTYEKLKEGVGKLPWDLDAKLARYDGYVVYNRVAVGVLFLSALLLAVSIAGVMMRYRASLLLLMITSVTGSLAVMLLLTWVTIKDYGEPPWFCFVGPFLLAVVIVQHCAEFMISLSREKDDTITIFPELKKADAKDFPKPVGATMPKVQELYSFEDMPELSGMKAYEEVKAAEEAKRAEEVKAAEEAKAKSTLDLRHIEAMTAIGVDTSEYLTAMTEDRGVPDIDSDDVWLCGVCGGLNDHGDVCATCKSARE